jgi:hypothetical protein
VLVTQTLFYIYNVSVFISLTESCCGRSSTANMGEVLTESNITDIDSTFNLTDGSYGEDNEADKVQFVFDILAIAGLPANIIVRQLVV